MDITITYIGGGSKDWAHKYFSDILSQTKINGELRLYDIDQEAAEKNKKYFDKLKECNKDIIKCKWECKVINDIDEALKGCDFVLISILPYTLNEMKVDVHYPEKYGIYQSVGDSVGPGGYSRALRTLSYYRFFAQKIKENCKDAWVINYTNPMTLCINTLYKEFPDIKAFGCCHEVFGTQYLLASIVKMYNSLSEEGKNAFLAADLAKVKAELKSLGKNFNKLSAFEGIPRQEIKTNVQGINHFTWINKAEYKGEDIFPIYSAYIKLQRLNTKKYMKNYIPKAIRFSKNIENIKFELFEQYGLIAAAGDRHLAEFVPSMYLKQKNEKDKGLFLTPVWGRILYNKIRVFKLNRAINSNKKLKLKESGEEGISQISALCGLEKELITNVNLINLGQIPNLPFNTAVETNSIMTKDSVKSVDAGTIKENVRELIQPHAEAQKEFTEAFFKKDKQGLLNAFLKDPAVAKLTKEGGEKLFNEMIEKNKHCLEDFITK